jgi:putative ABC transport system permease protein
VETLFQDVRFALRLFARNPWFAALAVVALALGIGANTAVFSVVHAVLIKPLPFSNPDALVAVYDTQPFCPTCPASFPKYVDWRDQNAVFDAIGGSSPGSSVLTGKGNPERIRTTRVTASLFRVFQSAPVVGRWISEDEDKPGGAPVAVLSYGFWQERFAGDPNVVGQTITLDGITRSIVGVMPVDFTVQRAQVWVPLALAVDQRRRGSHFMPIVARLKPGVSVATAQREMIALGARLAKQYPTNHGIDVVSYRDVVVGDTGRSLLVLLGSVAFVLLIACANVANLLLARAASRRREITIRTALGAARARLARQLLTESVLLALVGGAFGVLLAFWGVRAFVSMAPLNFPRLTSIGVDAGVLTFTLAISVLTGVVFGLAPALHAFHQNPSDAIKQDETRSGSGRGVRRASSALVVIEIALSLVLLIGAGLMMKSLLRIVHQDGGFTVDRLLTFELTLPNSRYSDNARVTAFYDDALSRIRGLLGVQRAGAINMLPLVNWGNNSDFNIEGRTWPDGRSPLLETRVVRGDYFQAMGIRLLRGRLFTDRDNATAPKVVIINETVAQRFFAGEDPVGKRLTFYGSGGPLSEIVGVVASVRSAELSRPPLIEAYAPDLQYPNNSLTFVVRTTADPTALTAAIRQEIAAIDVLQPLSAVRTMEEVVHTSTARPRLLSVLTAVFALLAGLLAAVGIYGIMAYSVSQQTRAIGIRMAMGADPAAVIRVVLDDGVKLIAAGVALGAAGAFALTNVLTTMLYEVSPTDPTVFAATCAGVGCVALAACYVPARSATRVDPMIVLREL